VVTLNPLPGPKDESKEEAKRRLDESKEEDVDKNIPLFFGEDSIAAPTLATTKGLREFWLVCTLDPIRFSISTHELQFRCYLKMYWTVDPIRDKALVDLIREMMRTNQGARIDPERKDGERKDLRKSYWEIVGTKSKIVDHIAPINDEHTFINSIDEKTTDTYTRLAFDGRVVFYQIQVRVWVWGSVFFEWFLSGF